MTAPDFEAGPLFPEDGVAMVEDLQRFLDETDQCLQQTHSSQDEHMLEQAKFRTWLEQALEQLDASAMPDEV